MSINGRAAGRFCFQLFDDLVPITCRNFRNLCNQAADAGGDSSGNDRSSAADKPPLLTYRGSPFHRMIKGFCLQGGDVIAGDGSGGASTIGDGGPFADESFAVPHSRPGVLSMANMGQPNTNGCQVLCYARRRS